MNYRWILLTSGYFIQFIGNIGCVRVAAGRENREIWNQEFQLLNQYDISRELGKWNERAVQWSIITSVWGYNVVGTIKFAHLLYEHVEGKGTLKR